MRRACEEPVRQIVGNGGWEGAIVIEKIRANKDANYGFNAATGDYEDLVKAGVIDPTKVTRSALQNAASISALMLTTEAMICEIPEKKSAPPMGPASTAVAAGWTSKHSLHTVREGRSARGGLFCAREPNMKYQPSKYRIELLAEAKKHAAEHRTTLRALIETRSASRAGW